MDKVNLRLKINAAFEKGVYPGDWCLKGSTEGKAPFLLEKAFKGKTDWRALPPELLERDLGGWGTALVFFRMKLSGSICPHTLLQTSMGNWNLPT